MPQILAHQGVSADIKGNRMRPLGHDTNDGIGPPEGGLHRSMER
jgi:hypothetical protein